MQAMIEICAIGPLRVTAALWNAGKLVANGTAKIAMITSQGGSIGWRDTQNAPGPNFGGNYGANRINSVVSCRRLVGNSTCT